MASAETVEGPTSGRGKWSQLGVPHRGWTCVEIEDLGEPDETCGMCESQKIRFVHHMSHPDYPETLSCGCICAGHMEGDLAQAADRERRMKNGASRRSRWPSRKGWTISSKGNPSIKVDSLRITIFPSGAGFKAVIVDGWSDRKVFSRRIYPTVTAAKLAAFDRMLLGI